MVLKTERDGEKTTKVVVDDIYKVINRALDIIDEARNNSVDILDSIHKVYEDEEGELIIGTGISQPCGGDVYNEEVGNEIAFRKAKLNANIKKHNLLRRVYNEQAKVLHVLTDELYKLEDYIDKDISAVRKYNPNYLERISINETW